MDKTYFIKWLQNFYDISGVLINNSACEHNHCIELFQGNKVQGYFASLQYYLENKKVQEDLPL